MAFTDTEVQEAREAAIDNPSHQDLFRLGLIYSTDVEDRGPDYVEAHKWFNLAAMMGSQPARAYRSEITLEMSRQEISLAQRAARGWLKEQNDIVKPEPAKARTELATEQTSEQDSEQTPELASELVEEKTAA